MSNFDLKKVQEHVEASWSHVRPALEAECRIPNQSPQFDPDCLTNGLQEEMLKVATDWVDSQNIDGLKKRVVTCPGRTPVLLLEFAPTDPNCTQTVLAYGHLDKQPPMLPWGEGLDPYEPVIREEIDPKTGKKLTKLYGRGLADDAYHLHSLVVAVQALKAQNIPHARSRGLTEMCEESGSFDLPYYLDLLKDEIGTPDLVVCCDSNCGDYERLWLTTSLRGMVGGVLSVQISSEGVHSGMGSGIIPSTFRILRELLDRIEDSKTGEIKVDELHVEIPQEQLDYAAKTVEVLGDEIVQAYPFITGAKPVSDNVLELYLNRAWRPTLSYTGIGDIPSLQAAGNVLRPKTSISLSFRLPPTVNPDIARAALVKILEENPPYNAKVKFDAPKASSGFYAPPFEPWLLESFKNASNGIWGQDPGFESGGVSIPFLNIMANQFPSTQFAVIGLLGPHSNAHSSNEMMIVEYFFGLTCSVACVIKDHYLAKCVNKKD